MGKKFVGLGGLKHFWTKAKTWIAGQITAEVTAKIAELVANAPEDLDTLKEIADWISTHANDASAMNTQINTNKNDIAALQTSVAGKADTEHTHTKSQITDFPTSLPANGGTADSLFYTHSNEINFKGGAPGLCYFNYRNADTDGYSPVNTMEYRFCNYGADTSKSVLKAGSFDGATAKASSKMVIPIGAPSSLENGCIWIER